jgi:hypothetical protein
VGPIELQAHLSPLWFRNIFIRELPAEEPFAGPLFNGNDLTGWQVINGAENAWQVRDGILFTDGAGSGWLSTESEFGDFDLGLEFKISAGGNSGIFIRAPREGDPAYSGMEIQVLDDYAEEYKDLKKWQFTGSIYGIMAPAARVSLPADKWQKMRIICDGPLVKVYLNDVEIVAANLTDFMWQESSHPGIKRRRGFIGLQVHGSLIEYRNIILKEL